MTKTVERDVIPLKERQVNSAPLKNLLYKLFPRERNGRRNRAHVVYGRVKRVFISRSCGNSPARFHRILGVRTSLSCLYCTDVLFIRFHYFKVWRKNAIILRCKVPILFLSSCQTSSCSVDLDWWLRERDSSPLKIDNVKIDRVSEQKIGFLSMSSLPG